MTMAQLDEATPSVAQALVEAFQGTPWTGLRYSARWTPSGDVGADGFWVRNGSAETKAMPDLAASLKVSDASKRHWELTRRLGQPPWYQMTVIVERDGRFRVGFDDRKDYREGEIMDTVP